MSQCGETCLTFFSLVRHVSHLFQFLAQTLDVRLFISLDIASINPPVISVCVVIPVSPSTSSSNGSHLGRFSLGSAFADSCSTIKLSAASKSSCLLDLFLARSYRWCTAGDDSATLSCPSLIDGAQSGFSWSNKADGLPETI